MEVNEPIFEDLQAGICILFLKNLHKFSLKLGFYLTCKIALVIFTVILGVIIAAKL